MVNAQPEKHDSQSYMVALGRSTPEAAVTATDFTDPSQAVKIELNDNQLFGLSETEMAGLSYDAKLRAMVFALVNDPGLQAMLLRLSAEPRSLTAVKIYRLHAAENGTTTAAEERGLSLIAQEFLRDMLNRL